jgi:hypothetical protein
MPRLTSDCAWTAAPPTTRLRSTPSLQCWGGDDNPSHIALHPKRDGRGGTQKPREHQRPRDHRLPMTTKGGRPPPNRAWRSLDIVYGCWDGCRTSGLGDKATPRSSRENERGGGERRRALRHHPPRGPPGLYRWHASAVVRRGVGIWQRWHLGLAATWVNPQERCRGAKNAYLNKIRSILLKCWTSDLLCDGSTF